MRRKLIFVTLSILTSFACTVTSVTPLPPTLVETGQPTDTVSAPITDTATIAPATATETSSATPTTTLTATPLATDTPSLIPSNTALPTVPGLNASVTADRLSCRYGPGPEYLYLFAFRAGTPIRLIGRVDAENWNWVLVENEVPCWVSANFIDVEGDIFSLPIVYPGVAKLPISPYYPPSQVLSAQRNPATNQLTVSWKEVVVNLGDYEDESMQTYIIEVWRCEGGQLIFDPLATRINLVSFIDEPGCEEPSHGRVWVQDKHGYAGPAEIPWPE